mmetsp:Transcript_3578/g.14903  ORF Transcript_3578/g.14903 Transcript_3578/m.14903 type:complete len:303 (-) Transcript_3578:623-1531(-)
MLQRSWQWCASTCLPPSSSSVRPAGRWSPPPTSTCSSPRSRCCSLCSAPKTGSRARAPARSREAPRPRCARRWTRSSQRASRRPGPARAAPAQQQLEQQPSPAPRRRKATRATTRPAMRAPKSPPPRLRVVQLPRRQALLPRLPPMLLLLQLPPLLRSALRLLLPLRRLACARPATGCKRAPRASPWGSFRRLPRGAVSRRKRPRSRRTLSPPRRPQPACLRPARRTGTAVLRQSERRWTRWHPAARALRGWHTSWLRQSQPRRAEPPLWGRAGRARDGWTPRCGASRCQLTPSTASSGKLR